MSRPSDVSVTGVRSNAVEGPLSDAVLRKLPLSGTGPGLPPHPTQRERGYRTGTK